MEKTEREKTLNSTEFKEWNKHIIKERKQMASKVMQHMLDSLNPLNHKTEPQIELRSLNNKTRLTCTFCIGDRKPKVAQLWRTGAKEFIPNTDQKIMINDYLTNYIKVITNRS